MADLLNRPLVPLGDRDHLTVGDSFEGIFVTGQTGAGKTTGPGYTLLRKFFKAGYGGLICCPKPGDANEIAALAKACGREGDIIRVGPGWPDTINILDYERRRPGSTPENLVTLLSIIPEIAEGKRGLDGGDPFWQRSGTQLLRAGVDVMDSARANISLPNVYEFIADMPRDYEQMQDDAWRERSSAYQLIRRAHLEQKTPVQAQGLRVSDTYIASTFPGLGERTQGSIIATITSAFDMLLHGEAWRILANESTFVPENAYTHGKIFLFDMDIATHGDIGRLCNCLFKDTFQRAMLRRDVRQHPRPVFLFCDEAQYFISQFDYHFQSVARSARVATVYMTQNLANLHAMVGGHAKATVDALLGHLTTHIYCANSDPETNEYAAKRIGRKWQTRTGYSTSHSDTGQSTSASGNQTLEYEVEPNLFATIIKGGAPRFQVGAVVHRAGQWSNGKTWLPVLFKQGGPMG